MLKVNEDFRGTAHRWISYLQQLLADSHGVENEICNSWKVWLTRPTACHQIERMPEKREEEEEESKHHHYFHHCCCSCCYHSAFFIFLSLSRSLKIMQIKFMSTHGELEGGEICRHGILRQICISDWVWCYIWDGANVVVANISDWGKPLQPSLHFSSLGVLSQEGMHCDDGNMHTNGWYLVSIRSSLRNDLLKMSWKREEEKLSL